MSELAKVVDETAAQRRERQQQRNPLAAAIELAQWAKAHPADATGPTYAALVALYDALTDVAREITRRD